MCVFCYSIVVLLLNIVLTMRRLLSFHVLLLYHAYDNYMIHAFPISILYIFELNSILQLIHFKQKQTIYRTGDETRCEARALYRVIIHFYHSLYISTTLYYSTSSRGIHP